MTKPRNARRVLFPFAFEKNGRKGRIYKLGNGTYKTHFLFAGEPKQNTFKKFETAYAYLEGEFSSLDHRRSDALSLNPLNSDVRTYSELEQLLRAEGNGATLREAVTFFLAHQHNRQFKPITFVESAEAFIDSQRANNISNIQIKTLQKHFRSFGENFGSRKIHEITALEVNKWLATRKSKKTHTAWSPKTRRSVRGSLVSLSLFAQNILRAIPDQGKTEFQKVGNPKPDNRPAVEIYTPNEFRSLLVAAIEYSIDLIPGLVLGGFEGLRPYEFHGEGLKRGCLGWDALNWNDSLVHVVGQKIRSKATRDIPFHNAAKKWLQPFRHLTGPMWLYKKAYEDKMNSLRKRAGVQSIHDGYRHSYASYRIRKLGQDLPQLAAEMGNSPTEILNSYKRNVTDVLANTWFSEIEPPSNYDVRIEAALALR